MTPLAIFIGMMVGVLVTVGLVLRAHIKGQDAAERSWADARARLGFDDTTLDHDHGTFDYSLRAMGGECDGVAVEIRAVHTQSSTVKYRTQGTAGLGHTLPFQLSKRGLLGGGAAATGDAAFDAVFVVETDDPVAAAESLTPSAREALLAIAPLASTVTFDGSVLELQDLSDWTDGARAEAAAVLLAAAIRALRGGHRADAAYWPDADSHDSSGVKMPDFVADAAQDEDAEAREEGVEVARSLKL